MKSHQVGVVGCGNIFSIYADNLTRFEGVDIVAVTDLDSAKARLVSEKYGYPILPELESMLRNSDIDTILNLTHPVAHFEVSRAALKAGKNVYSEKPLALSASEGRQLVQIAGESGRRLGCAPDTVLGAGIQTCRSLIDTGVIGKPIFTQAFMLCRGHESWHPNPEFYYEPGGGPMLDMGPYYLSALFQLLGPIQHAAGVAKRSFDERTITSQPLAGRIIRPQVNTHVMGQLEFASGATGSIVTSFDTYPYPYPHIVVFGSEGTLEVPDPNGFGGPIRLSRAGAAYEEVPLTFAHRENSRGLGLIDMLVAETPRASGEVAQHVLEVMLALGEGTASDIASVTRPPAMPQSGYPDRN